jgi:capsular polysaccharide biosynthesis protein
MQELGFSIIHPQEMTILQQIRYYQAAECIAGEYSSALHNTVFAQRGTKVIALNRVNWYQSLICRAFSQRLALIPPADGVMRDWRLYAQHRSPVSFIVECANLREQVDAFLEPLS